MTERPSDPRVFGPYYSTSTENRKPESRTEWAFQQPVQPDRPARTSLRQRLLTGRRRRTNRP